MRSLDVDSLPANCTPCYDRTDLFFSDEWADIQAAKKLCETCLLRPACLERALNGGIPHGIFGGLTADERGYYKRLFPGRVTRVQELPVRFQTRPKKRERAKLGRPA